MLLDQKFSRYNTNLSRLKQPNTIRFCLLTVIRVVLVQSLEKKLLQFDAPLEINAGKRGKRGKLQTEKKKKVKTEPFKRYSNK